MGGRRQPSRPDLRHRRAGQSVVSGGVRLLHQRGEGKSAGRRPGPDRAIGQIMIHTPDRRYTVVDSILQRATNPALSEAERVALVTELFEAKQAVKNAGEDYLAMRDARTRIDQAMRAL